VSKATVVSYGSKLPEGWSIGTMADVIADIVAGTSVNCEDRDFRQGDRRVLKLSAVSKGRFDARECKVAARSEHPTEEAF